jgi:hypothetical protein
MRKKQVIILLFLFVLINVSVVSLALLGEGKYSGPPALLDRNPIDVTPEMLGEKEIAMREYAAEVGSDIATGASPVGDPATVGEVVTVACSDFYLGVDYDQDFVVLMDGTHGIICIQKEAYDDYDAVTDEYVFPNPNHVWRIEDRISTAQFAYLLDEFDTNMYPTVTTIYGEPLARGDEGQKVWILIFNIRGASYYDPAQTSYIAGYFSSSTNAEQNKNIMHIDTYDWANRIGPGVARPYLYEGVFAHEFEHLVHFDADPDEPSWVDEGLADLAGFFCGYGHSQSHLAYYMVFHPFVSLTFWGGGLEDYGASYLFALYLYEKFGGATFISALVEEQANGIEGIENTLAAFSYSETFDEIFDAWTIANYLDDSPFWFGDKYEYDTLDIPSDDTWGWSIEAALQFWWGIPLDTVPFAWSSDWPFGLEPQPYTAHYYRFTTSNFANAFLDGDDFSGNPAYSGSYEWYSDAQAWAWRSFYQTFAIPATGATLNFYTFFEIEGDWDYGYVEVYDHDADEWYTLDASNYVMTTHVAHAQDNPNTPDEREPTAYEAAGRWFAFTDYSGGWVPVSMDLNAFSGHTIDLYFTLWQDGAFTLQNMYVDDIEITGPEIYFFDDVESGEGDWMSTSWYITDGILDNGFAVTLLTTRWDFLDEPFGMHLMQIRRMNVNPGTQSGSMFVFRTSSRYNYVKIAIVSNRADHILSSHYEFWVDAFSWGW